MITLFSLSGTDLKYRLYYKCLGNYAKPANKKAERIKIVKMEIIQ